MKTVISVTFGGFSVTKPVFDELGLEWNRFGYLRNEQFHIDSDNPDAYRSDLKLIAAIEKVGTKESSGPHARLRIVEIPDDIMWYIHEYDGNESVHEAHRIWRGE